MKALFKTASKEMEFKTINKEEIFDKLVKREESSSTALSPYFAIPHIIVEEKDTFKLLIVRSKKGIIFTDKKTDIHAMFFLIGSIDQRHFHLVVLSALAQIVQAPSFEREWQAAKNANEIRQLIHGIKKSNEMNKES